MNEVDPQIPEVNETTLVILGSGMGDTNYIGAQDNDVEILIENHHKNDKQEVSSPDISSLPPKAQEIILERNDEQTIRTIGGGALNVAINAAVYSKDLDDSSIIVHPIISLGHDESGDKIMQGLLEHDVDISGVTRVDGDTGGSTIIVGESGPRMVYVYRGASRLIPDDVKLPETDGETVLHATSLGGNLVPVISLLEQKPDFVSWDAGSAELQNPDFADVFEGFKDQIKLYKANSSELAHLHQAMDPRLEPFDEVKDSDMIPAMERLLIFNKHMTLLITHGSRGMWLGSHEAGIWEATAPEPPNGRPIYELGAGDAAATGALLALGQGLDFNNAAVLARLLPREVIEHVQANLHKKPDVMTYLLPEIEQISAPLKSRNY